MPCAFQDERPYNFSDLDSGCQFKVAEPDLVYFDGKNWCEFHLPVENEAGDQSPKAGWDEDRVELFNKKIFKCIDGAKKEGIACDLSGVVFPGSIDFKDVKEFPKVSFFNSTFEGGAEFDNATFKDEAMFENATFERTAWFINAKFEQFVGFDNATFEGTANFGHAKFEGMTRFNNSTFNLDAKFYNSKSEGGIDFDNSTFNVEVKFDNAKLGWASFDNAKLGWANFDHTKFEGNIRFGDATFEHFAGFHDTLFNASANFENAHFKETVSFNNAYFKEEARFGNIQFEGQARFDNSQFKKRALFKNVHFGGQARFDRACFYEFADFSSGTKSQDAREDTVSSFSGLVKFSGATFKEVTFQNQKFFGKADFSNCTFHKAPNFHGCELHQNTTFPKQEFFKDTSSNGAAQAYRTLRLAMKNTSAHGEEGMFYALEQKSQRNKNYSNYLDKELSRNYEVFSDYGGSVSRPIFNFFAYNTLFLIFYGVIACISKPVLNFPHTLAFTVQQVVIPFSAWSTGNAKFIKEFISDGVVWVQLLATIQSLSSSALLGLLVFALGRRFKRG